MQLPFAGPTWSVQLHQGWRDLHAPILLTRRATVAILGVATVAFASPVLAQSAARVRATIVGVAGDQLTIRTKDDQELKLRLVEPLTVSARVRTDPSAIKPGSYVGAAAVPGKNGTLAGVEVFIFPEASRGAGKGIARSISCPTAP